MIAVINSLTEIRQVSARHTLPDRIIFGAQFYKANKDACIAFAQDVANAGGRVSISSDIDYRFSFCVKAVDGFVETRRLSTLARSEPFMLFGLGLKNVPLLVIEQAPEDGTVGVQAVSLASGRLVVLSPSLQVHRLEWSQGKAEWLNPETELGQ